MSIRLSSVAAVFQPSSRVSQAGSLQRSPAQRLGNQTLGALVQDKAKARHDRLAKLAEDPADAHRAWPRLSAAERDELMKVLEEMYGKDFASQFLEIAEAGTAQLEHQYWQPGAGPSPRRLRELGYRRKGKIVTGNVGVDLEWWVHPSGKSVQRDLSPRLAVSEEGGESPPVDDQAEAVQMLRQMTVANNQLAKYCAMRPLDEGKAVSAIMDFAEALGRLRNKLKDVDMSRHPHFWRKVEDQITRYSVVRVPCCEEQPNNWFFDCKSIMGPDDDDE